MHPLDRLEQRIADRSAVVGVVGLGYVGLPLAAAMHDAGFRTVGFDTDHAKIEALTVGAVYIDYLGEAMVRTLAESERFDVTSDMARLGGCDAVLVCVPTPLKPDRSPELCYVTQAAEAIGRSLEPGRLVVLESTTYPGTTRGEFASALFGGGGGGGNRVTRDDVLVAFSPEREDPGNAEHTTRSIPKLVGGLDERATRVAASFYGAAFESVVPVASAEVAEAAKILENVYRAVNIALVNEMKMLFDAMDIDVWDVIRAASTKPFGYTPFWPGPGLGGHCIPIDPYYLSHRAEQVGMPARFVELAGEINHAMPGYIVDRTLAALRDRGVAADGARVLVMGLAYKPDIGDVRESPSFELIERLRAAGADAQYHDPFVPKTWKMRNYDLGLASTGLTKESIAAFDAVIISTAHSAIDYGLIAEHARLVVDTRDAMRPHATAMHGRLIRA
ncbi:MAG: nucleotide sugar dehydrogenase [Planctomycetota bacterium]